MKTKVQRINPEQFRNEELADACRILQQEGLVAFPTETVYGLGGNGMHPGAARKIYAAKGRPSDNPLILHIADRKALEDIAKEVNKKAECLAEAFWPGPLTMIFQKSREVPYSTTGGLDTVAVRMPSHPIARELIRQSGIYIAAPSANISGRPSPTLAEHVVEDLDGRVDIILDGGPVGIGLESTIIDMSVSEPIILRPGYITKSMLESVIGKVRIDPAVTNRVMDPDLVAKAPGMKYRHYAPQGQLVIVEGNIGEVINKINQLVMDRQREGKCVAVIATEETKERYQQGIICSIGSRKCEGSIAAGLYDILRKMDHLGAEYIYAESFEEDDLGQAIMNRMWKAAGYRLLKA